MKMVACVRMAMTATPASVQRAMKDFDVTVVSESRESERERERERERETYIQTDRQTTKRTDWLAGRQTDRQRDTESEIHTVLLHILAHAPISEPTPLLEYRHMEANSNIYV